MWQSQSFPSVELALAFVNEHRLRADQFKVMAARWGWGSRLVVWVLYQADEAGLAGVTTAAAAEPEPLSSPVAGNVVDEAEAIIADAQREEG